MEYSNEDNRVVNFRSTLLCALCVGLFGGCAALPKNIAMPESDRSQLHSASIVIARQVTPEFFFTTPGQALIDATVFGAFAEGGVSWAELVKVQGLPDFTDSLGQSFLSDLGKDQYDFSESDIIEAWDNSADFSRFAKYDSDYVLEFRTRNGIFGYKPLNWQTYQMSYFGEAVLIRLSDLQPVWKATCEVKGSDHEPMVLPGEDFFEGDGKQLRAAAGHAVQDCSRQLARAFTGNT